MKTVLILGGYGFLGTTIMHYVDEHLRAKGFDSLYFIGDGSGWTHSLSQSSASGLYVAEQIAKAFN